jgi:hypothetical protein
MARILCLIALLAATASALDRATAAQTAPLLPCYDAIDAAGKATCLPIPSTAITAGNNAKLAAMTPVAGSVVVRLGFAVPGDGPPLWFVGSAAPCTLAGGDGASQVPAGAGCWLGLFTGNLYDIRYFGAVANNTTPADAAVQKAVAAAQAAQACAFAPTVGQGFRLAAAINAAYPLVSQAPGCLRGDVHSFNSAAPGIVYTFNTTDTNCITIEARTFDVEGISCRGNGATSTNPINTVCVESNRNYQTSLRSIYCSGYVTCFSYKAPTIYHIDDNLVCEDRTGYPNLVNNYPSFCIRTVSVDGGTYQANNGTAAVCRMTAITRVTGWTGDGTRIWFDWTLPAPNRLASIPVLWAADGLKYCLGPELGCKPQVLGQDYTLWDCGAAPCAGFGGTQLFGVTASAAFTKGNPQIAVASTAGWRAGTDILAWAEHGLADPTFVVSIDDATHLTLSTAPYITNPAVKLSLVQLNIGSSGGSTACRIGPAPRCGHNLEARFLTPPGAGVKLRGQWIDPWGYAAIWDYAGGNNYWQLVGVGGYRTIFRHTGTYGGDVVHVNYTEFVNYCMIVEELGGGVNGAITGDVMTVARNTRPDNASGTVDRCLTYIAPNTYASKLMWNGSDQTKYRLINAAAFTLGSATAPLNATAARLDFTLSRLGCSAGALTLTASEDGVNFLAGANYAYHVSDTTPAATTDGGVAGSGAAYPVSATAAIGAAPRSGGQIRLYNTGQAHPHPVRSELSGLFADGAAHGNLGAGVIAGAPAPLKAVRLACPGGTISGIVNVGYLW